MRVYVPATLPLLRAWVDAERIPVSEEWVVPADDLEESEYDALLDAADASAALLRGPGRRVVVVAEAAGRGAALPLRDVVAVHADTEDVSPDDSDPPELAWFATQEIPDLL